MSTLVKLGIRANVLCIIGMVVAAVAVYAFNLGGWKIGGIPVFSLLVFFTFAALIISFLQDLIFKPMLSSQAAKLAWEAVILARDESLDAGQGSYMSGVIYKKNRHEKTRYILGAIIGAIVYFALGVSVGSPFAEFVALAVLLLGPTIMGLLMHESLMEMRSFDPELFDSAIQLYSSAHSASFDASLIA